MGQVAQAARRLATSTEKLKMFYYKNLMCMEHFEICVLKINILETNTSIEFKFCTLDPGCRRGGDFSSLLRVQTGPGVHSTSYEMSTGGFPRE